MRLIKGRLLLRSFHLQPCLWGQQAIPDPDDCDGNDVCAARQSGELQLSVNRENRRTLVQLIAQHSLLRSVRTGHGRIQEYILYLNFELRGVLVRSWFSQPGP